jgi:hypothetical protein
MAAVRIRKLCIRGPRHIAIACVTKVAHTAIKHAVLRSLGYLGGEDDLYRLPSIYRKHPALNLCSAHEAVAQNYKVFAFVRDPFDRLVSLWAKLVIEGDQGFLQKTGAEAEMPFAAFVMECMTPKIIKIDTHAATQSSFIPKQAIIFRYETIKDGWAEIKKVWPGLVDLTLINPSVRDDIQKYETSELKQKCRELYAIDYQRFGYV